MNIVIATGKQILNYMIMAVMKRIKLAPKQYPVFYRTASRLSTTPIVLIKILISKANDQL